MAGAQEAGDVGQELACVVVSAWYPGGRPVTIHEGGTPRDVLAHELFLSRSALWAADRVRHLPLIAPGVQLSNTRGTTPRSQSEFNSLVDDSAGSDGPREANTHPMEEERCHSTEA